MTDALTFKIMDVAAKEKVYEGLSPVIVREGDDIGIGDKGNDYNRVVTVFGVKLLEVSLYYWWAATEKKIEEPDDPCDGDYMKDIST